MDSKHKKSSDSKGKNIDHVAVLKCARAIRDLKQLKIATLAEKASYDAKYFMTDSKGASVNPFNDKLKLIDLDLQANLLAVQAVLGKMNNYEVELATTTVFPSTVTTGVVNAVATITAGPYADFSALAGLFEEYKIVRGEYEFVMGCELASSSTTPANTGITALALGYSINSTPLTGTAAAADDGLMKEYFPVCINAAGRFMVEPKQGSYRYKWRTQPGVTSVAPFGADTWFPTTDSTSIMGYLKTYTICATATVTANAINGIVRSRFHFRNRI